MPSPGLMKIACLGYDNLLSDVFWLRTVRYVHNQQKGAKRFDMLDEMLDVVTRLDPYACDTYERGGCWLYQDAGRPNDGMEFMQKGLRLVPKREERRWKLAYHIGQCFRDVLYDEKSATRYFEMAREMPGAPRVLAVAVAAGYERQGMFEKAIELWEEARDDIDTEQAPSYFNMNNQRAIVANEAVHVQRGLDLFEGRFGYRPKDLRGLVSVGLLSELPENSVVFQLRIMEIRATMQMMESLRNKINDFGNRLGRPPKGFSELIEAGMLDSVPKPAIRDAGGEGRFELLPSGDIKYVYIPQGLS